MNQLKSKDLYVQSFINESIERIDRVNSLYKAGFEKLDDSLEIDVLKHAFMNLRFNYKDHKRKYRIQFNPFNDSQVNLKDSADLEVYKLAFEKIKQFDLSLDMRKLYFTEITIHALNYYYDQMNQCDFSFNIIEFGINAPHKIWHKNEKAFIIVAYYEVSRLSAEIEIADQFFNKTSVQFNLPKTSGPHIFAGTIKVAEAGKMVPRPFEVRFWVN